MMGVFHAQSGEELEILASSVAPQDGPNDAKRSQMEHALLDVTAQNEDELWHTMKEKLEALSMGLYR
jgi:TusA-related sulfurtransferase